MSKFHIGDKVRKVKGCPFVGTVCAVYEKENKCCVKHKDQWEHIFNDDQLDYDHPEYAYLDLLKDVLENGHHREGRNGGVRSLFGRQIRFNLEKSFPLLTTKKLHTKSIVGELLWFLRGEMHIRYLKDNGITIWDEWASDDEMGYVGNMYGAQWRFWMAPSKASFVPYKTGSSSVYVKGTDLQKYNSNEVVFNDSKTYTVNGTYGFGTIDQISNVIKSLKEDPYGRRHIVSAWNPDDVDSSVLPPCHILFQFYVVDNKLSCHMYQRSADLFLGVPFNIASYALLTNLIAREVGLYPGELIISFGDVHLYDNHIEQAKLQLERKPLPLPYLYINKKLDKNIFELEIKDITFMHYHPHPAIPAPVSK